MRLLITGVTGLLGRRLTRSLAAAGHQVVGVSRDPERARERLPELTDASRLEDAGAFEGVDAVFHLAGEPVAGRWTKKKKAKIHGSRREGTRAVVDALVAAGVPTLISTTAIGWYGDRGDEDLPEDAPPPDLDAMDAGARFLAEVCRDWEIVAERATEHGVRVVRLRFGLVLDPEGGALGEMLTTARLGISGPLGGGRQWWSWIHVDDAIALLHHALDSDVSGPLNGATETPERQRDFARTLGRVLHRPAFLPAPGWALKVILGQFAAEVLTSKRVLPVATLASGFTFQHPELEPALQDLLA